MGKIAYITTNAPFEKGEGFVVNEMVMLKNLGANLVIFPRDFSRDIFHRGGEVLVPEAYPIPIFSLGILKDFMLALVSAKGIRVLGEVFRKARGIKIIIKNLIVFPKAVHLARRIKDEKISVVHAHWGSTTSTMAYIINRLSGIPWGMTLHRWDITENNMLEAKVKSASFVRCISDSAKRKLNEIIGDSYDFKVRVIHMGTERKADVCEVTFDKEMFVIVVPATFIERKGHKYLIEAVSILRDRGFTNVRCYFYGLGPLKQCLKRMVKEKDLDLLIGILDYVPQNKFEEMYRKGEVDVVILPSIDIGGEDGEGIPVSLMDAMSYGVAVISTDAGGIPELIGDGSGVMVGQKDSRQLADAIGTFIEDRDMLCAVGRRGKQKVEEDFSLKTTSECLLELFKSSESKDMC